MSESESMDSPDVIGPSAPMPTDAEAWKARFMNRIIGVVLSEGWPESMGRRAAETEYNGLDEPVDLSSDPEAEADDSMSYWDADE